MRSDYTISAESVTEGHPDKLCDRLSDAVLDDVLRQDRDSRVACECYATTGMILVGGEITTKGYTDFQELARGVAKGIGYTNPNYGLDFESMAVLNVVHSQSPDISQGVSQRDAKDQGAGDQGMMYGYANRDTPELMPMPIYLAHRLAEKLAEVRKSGALEFLRPDGKSQVTVVYRDHQPVALKNFTLAAQHDEDVSDERLREGIIEEVVKKAIPQKYLATLNLNDPTQFLLNGTGRFVIGGPHGDTGLTGRKIIVDSYGGFVEGNHGGGAFSGKDPSKVDRSGAYMARHIAKNIVASGLADRCLVQLAYTIGVAEPNNLMVDSYGTGKIADEDLENLVRENFPLRPGLAIEYLKLKNPIFFPTSAYGHFGRKPYEKDGLEYFTWEKTDKAEELRDYAKTMYGQGSLI